MILRLDPALRPSLAGVAVMILVAVFVGFILATGGKL